MKKTSLLLVVAAFSWVVLGQAQEKSKDAKAELQALVTKVRTQLQTGKRTETDLAPALKEFDDLIQEHKGEKTEDVANIVRMKAMLYVEVIKDTDKGVEILKQLKKDYPDTQAGKIADSIIANVEARKKYAVGATFPDFNEKDLEGKPLSIANYKGKLVLVDFWATWCGPCVGELPNVLKTYEKYHSKGFEIIGVSLDNDRDKLTQFIKDKGVTWRQYFDGKGWQNKLARQYGIDSIPATFLLDGTGKILARDLRGEELATEVGQRLAKP